MALIDADQRIKATDPALSFIVQAPAGSGKTEILTQRYLRLLGTVTAPEQIIALTFTRKAASEMRERIILALQQAAADVEARSAHQQMTLEFAKAALHRSEQFNWSLLQQTNRLRICTIDALCQRINHAIPLFEQQIAYAKITDKPLSHYRNAARPCIQFALEHPEYQAAMTSLLLHVDNRQDRLILLLTALLGARDQWLRLLFQARAQDKSSFEQALAFIIHHELSRFQNSLPMEQAKRLVQLARELACIENNPDSPRYILRDWIDWDQMDPPIAAALAKLLLTSEQGLRKAFDHHVGLKRDACSVEKYNRLKNQSKELLAQLGDCPEFLEALIQVSQLPKPEYKTNEWTILQALFQLLPLLLSHLQVIFSEHNEVDFSAISQQALLALGEPDNPTDLALHLDASIHHILVDEFQDTSIHQFEFISQLVQGWQRDEPKTLFIVGDPMQSIYRFRQAEVGLFFRAKAQGIGPVGLNFLQLQCNFRSCHRLVTWVNQQFVDIFPKNIDIESGAVSFHASVALDKNIEDSAVFAQKYSHKGQEAEAMVQQIAHELQRDPKQSIAVLVRSRSHLPQLIRLLRQHQIPYQGSEIDLLANLPHLRDLYSLMQALLFPANRLSWLAVLRSPYSGLSLADLLCIARFDKKKSIRQALLHLDEVMGLSDEGRLRATHFIKVMNEALALRHRKRLSEWLAQILNHFHIEKILTTDELEDLDQFWGLLDRYESEGRIPDWNEFIEEFNRLYSQQANSARLQIMTIHKSKGLEFDTVFLPGLGSSIRASDKPLLRWLQFATKEDKLLLVSPIHASGEDASPLYDYIQRLDDEKSLYETQRLLYVAVTRAKTRLYLTDCSSKNSKHSFLSLLKNQVFIPAEQDEEKTASTPTQQLVFKLPLSLYDQTPSLTTNPTSFVLNSSIPRLRGIVSHRILQWICEYHPADLNQIPWELAGFEFKKLGFNEDNQAQSLALLQSQIKELYQDPRGLWMIKAHEQERNEYAILVEHQGRMATRIIDRTFIEKDKLWIIDFKTGSDDVAKLNQHQQQLNAYAAYLAPNTKLRIHCGLYYLTNGHWIEWARNNQLTKLSGALNM